MIVCHCHRVTDREIRACVRGGARSCEDVGDACGAGTGCGGCVPLVHDLVQESRRLTVVKAETASSLQLLASSIADGLPQTA